MKKYNVFKLYIVKVKDYYFICEKSFKEHTYTEIFTKENFYLIDDQFEVEPLSDYYSLLAIMNYSTGEPLMLTKKELLIKYAEINSSNIEKRKQHNSNYETFIKEQNEYIEALKKLKEKNPEKAKQIAIDSLKRTGILDEKGELAYPYNLASSDDKEICMSTEHGKLLERKK